MTTDQAIKVEIKRYTVQIEGYLRFSRSPFPLDAKRAEVYLRGAHIHLLALNRLRNGAILTYAEEN